MPTSRSTPYYGPAFFSVGLRPFFLFASTYTALSMFVWLPVFLGKLDLLTTFAVVDWHIHEWIFGFLPAVATGFLFTAVPNWTGRMPIRSLPLALLLLVWITGRFAVTFSSLIGWQVAAIIDLSFLVLVTIVIAREIVVGKNWRNLKVLIPLSILTLANGLFHLESALYGSADFGRRLGLCAAIILIILIGGRIIPSFTRNWLVRENPGQLPTPFGKIDLYSIIIAVIGLLAWVVLPDNLVTGVLLCLAGLVQLFRMARWAGYRTLRDPLVLILHISYLFIPIGLLLLSANIFAPNKIPAAAGIHALGVGAIGGMTLSVMVRASLGHTGRELKASFFSIIIFSAIIVAASARIFQTLSIGHYQLTLYISGAAWILAFGGFALTFAPALLRPKN